MNRSPLFKEDLAVDRWDVLLAALAAYVAVVSLVRLMAQRRNELMAQIRAAIEQEQSARHNAEDGEHRHDAA